MQDNNATKWFAKSGFINWFDMVNRPPQANSKVDILSVSYSLEQMSYLTLKHHCFVISFRWLIYQIDLVDKPQFLFFTFPPTNYHSFLKSVTNSFIKRNLFWGPWKH